MKLGLLVALAVAVLVPSLSEGRTVSRCELRDKLGEAITLPRRLQRYKEKILAIVICQVNRRSHLNTGLVKVYGKRKTTTAKPTTVVMTTKPTTTKPTTTEATTTEATTTEATTTKPTTAKPTTTEATTTEATTTEATTTEATTTEATTTKPTTTKPTTTEATTTEATTTEATTTEATTTETTTTETTQTMSPSPPPEPVAINSTLEPNRTALEAGEVRRKREADTTIEESDTTEMDRSLEEMLNKEESNLDEEEVVEDDDSDDSDDEDEDEQEPEEGGKRKKRAYRRWRAKKIRRPWSLGYYGLFQLSDKYFCNSGYRWSRNRCHTTCGAFTDDDIMDDIDCFVKSGYWWVALKTAPHWCYHTWNFFNECE